MRTVSRPRRVSLVVSVTVALTACHRGTAPVPAASPRTAPAVPRADIPSGQTPVTPPDGAVSGGPPAGIARSLTLALDPWVTRYTASYTDAAPLTYGTYAPGAPAVLAVPVAAGGCYTFLASLEPGHRGARLAVTTREGMALDNAVGYGNMVFLAAGHPTCFDTTTVLRLEVSSAVTGAPGGWFALRVRRAPPTVGSPTGHMLLPR